MTFWLILLLAWLAGVPLVAFVLAAIGVGYDVRVARAQRSRQMLGGTVIPMRGPLGCASRTHSSFAGHGLASAGRHWSPRRRP